MDPRTGELHYLDPADLRDKTQGEHPELVELSDLQARILAPQSRSQRKNYMRNQPCVCGSGKKFKRCCWTKF